MPGKANVMDERLKRGWGYPINAKKAHYFADGITSICSRWWYGGELYSDDDTPEADRCAICNKRHFKAPEVPEFEITETISLVETHELKEKAKPVRPNIVCLCGSTRFSEAFQAANLRETLEGHIVLTIGCDMRSDAEVFAEYSEDQLAEVKAKLDQLHLHKIDMADEVLILNVGGYIGESTRRELAYALAHGKTVRWLESKYTPQDK